MLSMSQLSVVVALAAMASAPASAFIIMNDPAQGTLRLDTTVRYNAGWRMGAVDSRFANMFGYDEGETLFKKHDMVMNRLDLLVESDTAIAHAGIINLV